MKMVSIKVLLEKEIVLTYKEWEALDKMIPEDFESIEELENYMEFSNLEIRNIYLNEIYKKGV